MKKKNDDRPRCWRGKRTAYIGWRKNGCEARAGAGKDRPGTPGSAEIEAVAAQKECRGGVEANGAELRVLAQPFD